MLQHLIVGLIVLACALHAAWVLMPSAWRRGLAGQALKMPLPKGVRARCEAMARAAPGCGCNGCDAGAAPGAPKAGASQPIRIVRRTSR